MDLESVNITHLDHNKAFLLERDADIIGKGEHRIQSGDFASIRREFDDKGWQLKCGPSRESAKRSLRECHDRSKNPTEVFVGAMGAASKTPTKSF